MPPERAHLLLMGAARALPGRWGAQGLLQLRHGLDRGVAPLGTKPAWAAKRLRELFARGERGLRARSGGPRVKLLRPTGAGYASTGR